MTHDEVFAYALLVGLGVSVSALVVFVAALFLSDGRTILRWLGLVAVVGLLAATATLLSGCAGPSPAYRWSGAIVYHVDGVGPTRAELRTATDEWLDLLEGMGALWPHSADDVRRSLDGAEVRWVAELDGVAGYLSGRTIVVEWRGCVARSAWHHELWHYVRRWLLAVGADCGHTEPSWATVEEARRDLEVAWVWCV